MPRTTRLLLAACLLLPALPAAGEEASEGREPPADAVLAALPFQRPEERTRVYVDLAPEGNAPFVMLLDTGAATSVITPLMAREMGVTVRRTKSSPYRRSTVLGRDLQFWVDTRWSDTGSRTGWEYNLLGADFLDDYVVEIDYPGRVVRFLDSKRYEVPERAEAKDEAVVRFKRSGTRILVPIELNGKSVHVMLDTGAPPALILSGKAARKLAVDESALRPFGEAGSTVGPVEVSLLEADSLRFAGFAMEPTPVLVAPKGWYNIAGPNDSVLGYDLLRQFVVRIDYPRKRIWLRRAGDVRPTFYGADYASSREVGALLGEVGSSQFAVWTVAAGGRAEAIGLREGDVIVPMAGETPATLDEVIRRIREGEELTVARPQGEVWVDVVLPEPEH